MTGPVAQMVALTCFANARLAGREIGTFFPTNSTCQFCEDVAFLGPMGFFRAVVRGRQVAATPDEWFRWLAERRAQVERAELVYIAHQLDFLVKV